MGGEVCLVLLEAVGKQAFIFETNRLRQNLGASQMVLESTTRLLAEVLPDEVIAWDPATSAAVIGSGRIEDGSEHEVVIATSGKALVLCRSEESAEQLVFAVTSRCTAELPGTRVVGVVERFEWGSGIDAATRRAHRRLDEVAAETAGARFLRLPVVEDCSLSGYAAARRIRRPQDNELESMSLSSIAKEAARGRAQGRLRNLGEGVENDARALEDPEGSWLAVVHADGNGLGAVFSAFGDALRRNGLGATDREWVEQFRALSRSVEVVTVEAFQEAVDASGGAPVVPIVLGGDDLTALTVGNFGWEFARRYLDAFAEKAGQNPTIGSILPEPLTASAGVAFVKHHFPFSDAYGLAEELASSAKSVKPNAAIDFHVLYDSSVAGLHDLRPSGPVAGWRSAGPFLLDGSAAELDRLVDALLERDVDGRRVVPRSQVQIVRESCSRTPEVAQREWTRIRSESATLQAEAPEGLFGEGGGTMLFDALALADVRGER